MTFDDRDKDWSDVTARQRTPRIASNHQKPRKKHETFSLRVSKSKQPENILIFDFWPPEL